MALSASMRAAQVSPSGKLSAAVGGTVTVRVTQQSDMATLYVAIGPVAAGPPATYADFTADIGAHLLGWLGPFTATFNESDSSFDITMTLPVGAGNVEVGDELWVGLFAAGIVPGPTDVPQFTAGPFTGIA